MFWHDLGCFVEDAIFWPFWVWEADLSSVHELRCIWSSVLQVELSMCRRCVGEEPDLECCLSLRPACDLAAVPEAGTVWFACHVCELRWLGRLHGGP